MKTTGEDAVKIDETTRKDLGYYKNVVGKAVAKFEKIDSNLKLYCCAVAQSLSCVQLSAIPSGVAYQAPLSSTISRSLFNVLL